MDATNNISLPDSLLAEIQSAAQAEHRSVDEVLTDVLNRFPARCRNLVLVATHLQPQSW